MKEKYTLMALVITVVLSGAGTLWAQDATEKAPEKKLTRDEIIEVYQLEGSTVKMIEDGDPGEDPDPDIVWIRDGVPYRLQEYPLNFGVKKYSEEGWVRAYKHINADFEIYREDERSMWVWFPVDEPKKVFDSDPEVYRRRDLSPEQVAGYEKTKLDFALVEPKKADRKVVFEEASNGLPKDGSWRNSAFTADMNGDGHVDIITPPQRGGMASLRPYIFLGNGQGEWTRWMEVSWPRGLNYGSVVADDFNHDGQMDLAFGVHLTGIAVLHGDGKGTFSDSSKGLPTDFATRRVVAADLNSDGWSDLIAVSEGPTMHDQSPTVPIRLRVFLNDEGRGWTERFITGPEKKAMGDWLGVGDLNGDGRLDIAASSIVLGAPDVLYLSEGVGEFKAVSRDDFVRMSYYLGNTVGRFSSQDRDDAVWGFTRHWIQSINPTEVPHPQSPHVSGLERVSVVDGKVVRTPIAAWQGKYAIRAIGSGDFDGDGNLDVAALGKPGANVIVVFFGDGKGGFEEAVVEGIEIPNNNAYDLTVDDLNGDGLDDFVILFENSEKFAGRRDGSVRAYLNRAKGKG